MVGIAFADLAALLLRWGPISRDVIAGASPKFTIDATVAMGGLLGFCGVILSLAAILRILVRAERC
jgi:hypothetical protein